ncbi:MAG: CidA/LrgA family protein [Thiohalocapsa sp.]
MSLERPGQRQIYFAVWRLDLRGGVPDGLGRVADGLRARLSRLVVPAGVGVMQHLATLGEQWLAVSVALVSALVLPFVLRWVLGD